MALFGLLNVDKPSGVTSRRVVDQVKRLVRPAKVGHAGTLDPLASGVLVIGVGQATRLVEYVQQMPKHYRAEFLLGRTSTTEDVEGEVTILEGVAEPSLDQLQSAAASLVGTIAQRPPAFSALKVSGQRAYDLARQGKPVELVPRKIEIGRLDIVDYAYPRLCLEIECGSGTYVRSLGRDLAEVLGTGAVMSALERRSIGHFTLESAVDPATLTKENLPDHLLPAADAVRGLMPVISIGLVECQRLGHGLAISLPGQMADTIAAIDPAGQLAAILTRRGSDKYSPAKCFLGG